MLDIKLIQDEFIYTKRRIDSEVTNRGFEYPETIMEGVDNSFDAGADTINILIEKEEYIPPEVVRVEDVEKEYRLSYIISDNGNGYIDMENFYEKSDKQVKKYKTIEEYLVKNGYFSFGNLSHTNLSSDISFYSKIGPGTTWIVTSLIYDEQSERALKSIPREISKEEIDMFVSKNINLDIDSGSILYVKGIRNSEVYPGNVNDIVENLLNIYGLTYYDEIKENKIDNSLKKKSKKIIINGQEVKPFDPLGLDLTDDYIKPKVFGKYIITLEEVLDKLNDSSLRKRIYNEYLGLFSREELLKEAITVTLVALNPNLINRGNGYDIIKRNYRDLDPRYFPSYDYKGFYIKRNNRYIGRALGMLGIVVDHPSHSKFRGEISFHPCFDVLFKIESNKNRNNKLQAVIIELIQQKIEEDESLSGNTTDSRIKNVINCKNPKSNLQTKVSRYERLIKKCETLKRDFSKYNESVENIEKILKDLYTLDKESDLLEIEEIVKNFEFEYVKLNNIKYKDIINIKGRINVMKDRKYLNSILEVTKYLDIISGVGSPLQEGELVNIFYLLYSLMPDKFEMRLLDYNTDKSLDSMIAINQDQFHKLNLNERYGKQYEILREEAEKYKLLSTGEKISLLEFKTKLKSTNMNHSLMLVSHIVCWEKTKGLKEIKADDGHYVFEDDKTKDVLRSRDGDLIKKVKVIYLKDLIESICNSKYRSVINE